MADDIKSLINDARGFNMSDDEILGNLSMHPVYGSRIKSLQGQANPKDILDVLGEIQAPVPEEPLSVKGTATAFARQGREMLEGVGSGVARTAVGLRDVAAKGAHVAGLPTVPEVPPVLREAAQPPQDASAFFKTGRAAETLGEFFLPAGLVSKGVKLAEGAGAAARVGVRALGEAAGAGSVTYAQTGGHVEDAAKASILAGGLSAGAATIGELLRAVPVEHLYVTPSFRGKFPERFHGERLDEIVGEAIDNGITVSRRGAKEATALEAMSKQARDLELSKHANDLVDLDVVRAPLKQLRDLAERAGGEDALVASIDARLESVERAHGARAAIPATTTASPILGPTGAPITTQVPGKAAVSPKITVNEAQDLKNFYQSLAGRAFGKEGVGTDQQRKLMSAGFMKAIEDISPEIRALNHDIQNQKLLKNAINKFIDRHPEILSGKTAVLMLFNRSLALSYMALSNQHVRSALAIALSRAGKATTGAAVGKVAGAATPTLFSPPPAQE